MPWALFAVLATLSSARYILKYEVADLSAEQGSISFISGKDPKTPVRVGWLQ